MTSKFFLLLLVLVSITLNSCRKGEEDPWLSLRSRDARLTGTWELVKWDGKSEVFENNSWQREDYAFENGELKVYVSGSSPIWLYGSGDMRYKIIIKKGGRMTQEFDGPAEQYDSHGYWHWVDGNKEKSMLEPEEFVLNPLANRSIFDIKKLSNKELILVFDHEEKYVGSDNFEGTYTHTFRFEKTDEKVK